MLTLDTFDFDRDGYRFRASIVHDESANAPWDREDGHGPVSDWTRRDKRPGERVLASDGHGRHWGGSFRYYDFAEAVRIARKDGWDAPPYKTGTAGERAARAAEADFRRLKAWCDDDWHYVGVVVTRIDEDGDPIGDQESLWGIESDAGDYFREVADELADQLIPAGFTVCP